MLVDCRCGSNGVRCPFVGLQLNIDYSLLSSTTLLFVVRSRTIVGWNARETTWDVDLVVGGYEDVEGAASKVVAG